MRGFRKGYVHISYTEPYFACPHCEYVNNDVDEKYLDRINNSKRKYTRVKCAGCREHFYLAMDMQGEYQPFKEK